MPINNLSSSDSDFELVPPNPGSLIQSLRAIGYDLPTAIADIIDNSISASAKNVWVHFYWNGENSYISIIDDGTGMSEDVLVNAMRLGSMSPVQVRGRNDLGRFGLGLKTASFSQCKKLTVVTKKLQSSTFIRCWDLDFVIQSSEWNLLKSGSEFISDITEKVEKLNSGTAVVLENLDRLTLINDVNNTNDQNIFLSQAESVKNHLSMVFHKFLERPNGLKIWINDREIKPWDPFLSKEPATQNLTEEVHHFFGDKLTVKPYILPHVSKISESVYKSGSGPKGWNAQQGFYVYRNSRMLVFGDWLGLGFLKEEHYKLARIMLEIPSTMDDKWGIDVKKSRAFPPPQMRQDLKRIAELTRARAVAIYRHRGKIVARASDTELSFTWERKILHGQISYTVNRNHPLIKELLDNPDIKNEVSRVLRMIEETLPLSTIFIDANENPVHDKEPYQSVPTKELLELAEKLFDILIKNGYSANEAETKLSSIEPFNLYPGLIMDLKKGNK